METGAVAVIIHFPDITGIQKQGAFHFGKDGETIFCIGLQFHGSHLAGDGKERFIRGCTRTQGTGLPAAHGHGAANVELFFYRSIRRIAIGVGHAAAQVQG